MSEVFHGPRAFIITPPGRTFLAFDADGLHLRIAAMYSRDPFINEALDKYDATGDKIWKPHIQNCSALFKITPQEAVELSNIESPKYTFAKNFIYMILNGGDVPALADAAASAGLEFNQAQIRILLDNWLARAILFGRWREGLLAEVRRTGMVVLPSGRRRRFYNLSWDKKLCHWNLSHKVIKEIYNVPLIGTEVDFMEPRFDTVMDFTEANPQWMLVLHSHDGFMLEGPESEAVGVATELLPRLRGATEIGGGFWLKTPWDAKGGNCWANLKKVKT